MTVAWGLSAIAVAVSAILLARRHNIRKFENEVASRRPIGPNGIVIGADPIELLGDTSHAVLIIHGFGDTPQSVKPLAVALNSAGWTVSVPLLAGHGRPLRQYAAARSDDWIREVTTRYDELAAQHEVVVVCGISMGAALAVLLTAARPQIPALVLLAPYLAMPGIIRFKMAIVTLVQFVFRYHPSTGGETSIHDPVARADALGTGVVTAILLHQLQAVATMAARALPLVKAPTLYLQSREDNRIPQSAAIAEFAKLGSQVKEQRWLTGCGHIITVDYCKDEVASQAADWFRQHTPPLPVAPRNR
ncbi:MAG: alpha/beta fold hydrolase [Gemmatimonadaceae bacterium]